MDCDTGSLKPESSTLGALEVTFGQKVDASAVLPLGLGLSHENQ